MDELRAALELATDDELQALTEILFRRKFNPIDYVCTPEPIDVQSQDRDQWIDAIEERFCFLAADGMTVLRRKTDQLSYRQVLIRVCRYLQIPYSHHLSTADLEAEIFLSLLDRAWKHLPAAQQKKLSGELQTALSDAQLSQHLSPALSNDPIGLLMKGGSALAVTSILRPLILQLIARQFALHAATYEASKQVAVKGGGAIAQQLQNQVVMKMACRGMAASTARYGAVRGALAVVGPALWMWFFADLGWRAIATNYGRVIPVIFTLAQIRLTRMECMA